MSAVRPPYTIHNLPEGFTYDPFEHRIYTPALNVYSILNDDNSVTCPPLTYQSVDAFVSLHFVIHAIQKREEIPPIKTGELIAPNSRYVHIKCLNCVIEREKLVVLGIFLSLILITSISIPISYYTWPNGVIA